MYFAAPRVFSIWIDNQVLIPNILNLLMLIWVLLSAFLSIYGTLLSGVGKLRLSLYHAGFVMIINIPLSVWLAGISGLGSAGVILATIIGLSIRLLFQPMQVHLLISGKARGVWNR
jgi:O-antigen/teichoic acid export membrane protein